MADWLVPLIYKNHKCCSAVLMVSHGIFGRKLKTSGEAEDTFDDDTLLKKKQILENLRRIEARSLSLMVAEMQKGKKDSVMNFRKTNTEFLPFMNFRKTNTEFLLPVLLPTPNFTLNFTPSLLPT